MHVTDNPRVGTELANGAVVLTYERAESPSYEQKGLPMKRFLLLYNGPPAPPNATHEGWPEWFDRIGDALVDVGSPMVNGSALHGDGTRSDGATSLNGFSIVQAQDRDGVLDLIADHPFVLLGSEYTIEVFEVPGK